MNSGLYSQPDGAGVLPEERDEEQWGLEIAQALDSHYPGHPWCVCFSGGALIIRHMEISSLVALRTGKNGFGSVLPPHRQGRRKDVVASAIRGAGEMLECFNMPRGKWSEDHPPQMPNWNRGKNRDFH